MDTFLTRAFWCLFAFMYFQNMVVCATDPKGAVHQDPKPYHGPEERGRDCHVLISARAARVSKET